MNCFIAWTCLSDTNINLRSSFGTVRKKIEQLKRLAKLSSTAEWKGMGCLALVGWVLMDDNVLIDACFEESSPRMVTSAGDEKII